MPRISVIVPVYNVEAHISKCVDSILSQSFKDFELILIDDGSSDNSSTACDNYSKLDSRVVVIHKNNGGLSSARNAGLDYVFRKSMSDYITFIDSDDWIDSYYFLSLVNMIEQNNADILCTSFFFTDGINCKTYNGNTKKDVLLDHIEATCLLVKDETIQSHAWSKLYKTSLFENVRYDETLSYMEDQATTFKVFYQSKNIFISNYAGYFYNQNNKKALTKTLVTNEKVVSGLKAYYSICVYPFKKDDVDVLVPPAQSALVSAYLMLIPYFKKRNASKNDASEVDEIESYIKNYKLVNSYTPNSKNNKLKKTLYILFPHLYSFIFKVIKKFQKYYDDNK